MAAGSATIKVIIYLLRRDIRLSDSPVFHEFCRLRNANSPTITHILPLYVFPAHQVEISGLIPDGGDINAKPKSPYPEARSEVAGFWRCGPHRTKFLAQSVWDLKQSLERVGNGLVIRAGMPVDILKNIIDHFDAMKENKREATDSGATNSPDEQRPNLVGVWMTADEGVEERNEQRQIQQMLKERGKELRLFRDEKFYVDDRDLPFGSIQNLPDVFTSFRKSVEPLRESPRTPLPTTSSLPPLLASTIPPQPAPFVIPDTLPELLNQLLQPLEASPGLSQKLEWPENTESAHPFGGGETLAMGRVNYLLESGAMTRYKDTRNGLVGADFSTKLSAYLAIGCITARQVHAQMVLFEDGRPDLRGSPTSSALDDEQKKQLLKRWKMTDGFGCGENKGTAGVRFELLWRDYFRLVARKYGAKLYQLQGLRGTKDQTWKHVHPQSGRSREELAKTREVLQRFCAGRTGIGLIDASQREIFLTGYTSNRARQNVASFLSKHLNVDWRVGAEWYEYLLVDYDAGNNWGNWQYVAGVGNDPREGRLFNPVKQALDYDKDGVYIKAWLPEVRPLVLVEPGSNSINEEKLMGLYQPWKLSEADQKKLGIKDEDFVRNPLVKISFSVGKKPRFGHGTGRGRGGGYGGRGRGGQGGGRGGRWWTGNMDKVNAAEQAY